MLRIIEEEFVKWREEQAARHTPIGGTSILFQRLKDRLQHELKAARWNVARIITESFDRATGPNGALAGCLTSPLRDHLLREIVGPGFVLLNPQPQEIIKQEFDAFHQSRSHPNYIHLSEFAALQRSILKRLES